MVPTLKDILARNEQAGHKFKVVSTFAGGGGSSTGYRMAGGYVMGVNEFIPSAQDSYRANYPDTVIFPQDIRKLTGDEILSRLCLKKGELDIFDGSPPCSSFSMCGSREEGWGKEKKYSDSEQRTDDLFFEYARLLGELQPKVFVAENVKGLVMGEAANLLGSAQIGLFGEHETTIFHTLSSKGYNVRYAVLNAADYGTPQNRERLIIIGVRNDLAKTPTFPIWKSTPVTLGLAFEGLVNTPEELLECRISVSTKGKPYAIYDQLITLKPGEQSSKFFNLVKCSPNALSPTLTQTAGNIGAAGICHWDNRKFTVTEAKIIMSFPRDYKLEGNYQEKIERLGRAVPPLLMKAVAEHIYETILKPGI